MGFTFNKGFSKEEKIKINNNLDYLSEYDESFFDCNKKGRTRIVSIECPECKNIRKLRLVDFLKTQGNLCNSCARKGNRNVSKRKDVRKKLSRKNVKDTSYVTPEWRKKFSKSRMGKKNPKYGKSDSNETRRLKRIAAINHIKRRIKNGGQMVPSYNLEACKLIDNFGENNGYIFQHAENGGEFYIKELGYWVDGYSPSKNIVIEYMEKWHKNQKEKDERRKKEIIKELGCKFIEIKE